MRRVAVTRLQAISIGVIIIIAVIASGSYFLLAPKPQQLQTIRFGVLPYSDFVVVQLGVEKGFFAEEGVNVTVVKGFPNAPAIYQAMMAGTIDVSAQPLNPAFITTNEQGGDFRAIASSTAFLGGSEEKSMSAFVIRRDLWDKGIRDISQMKGMKIGSVYAGSAQDWFLSLYVKQAGLKREDFQIIHMGDPKDLVDSLIAGHLDGLNTPNEPWMTLAIKRGAMPLKYTWTLLPKGMEVQFTCVVIRESFYKKHPDLVKAFLRGWVKTLGYYMRYAWTPSPQRDEIARIMANFTGLPLENVLETRWPYYPPDGAITWEGLSMYFDDCLERGLIKKKPTPDEIFIEGVTLLRR